MLCIVLLLSINQVYAQGKGVFFFFDEDSEETYLPEYTGDIIMEGDPRPKAYRVGKVKYSWSGEKKDGIGFKLEIIRFFTAMTCNKKK